jgi:hypothetical protein
LAQYYAVVRIGRLVEVLYVDVVEVIVGAFCGHVGEYDEDRFVDRVSLTWFSAQEQCLVVVHELDKVSHALIGDVLRGEPQRLTFQRPWQGHTGPMRPSSLCGWVMKVLIQSATMRSESRSLSASLLVLLMSSRSSTRNRLVVSAGMKPSLLCLSAVRRSLVVG